MQKVFKYKIPIDSRFSLDLPLGADILRFAEQSGQAYLWALVNPEVAAERRHFRIYGTGHPINQDGLRHIETAFFGAFVWHLFEEAKL